MSLGEKGVLVRFANNPVISRLSNLDPAVYGGVSGLFRIEIVDAKAMIPFERAWSNLAERSLEANVFYDPAFMLPLLQHDGFAGKPVFLLAWEESRTDLRARLAGLLPILMPKHTHPFGLGLVRALRNNQIALGAPLLDRERGIAAFEAMLSELSARDSRLSGVILADIPADGPFFSAWRTHCAETGRAIAVMEEHQRAVLYRRHGDRVGNLVSMPKAKRRKELRRQGRRLGDHGKISYRSAVTVPDVRVAIEQFLALETKGWKGRRQTALLSSPALATFTRTMSRLLAYDGRCRVDSLNVDGQPVAMGIILTAGSRSFFWKTAFDEKYAHLSPGVQFVHAMTQAQAEGLAEMTDSCAIANHPMIDRIWPDRLELGEYMIELCVAAGQSGRFNAALRIETLRRQAWQNVHAVVHLLPRKAVFETRVALARVNSWRRRAVLAVEAIFGLKADRDDGPSRNRESRDA